mgnify:CR=1 FL=1
MDLVYRLLGQGDQFFQTMRTGAAETKRADTQLDKFTSTMDRQRSAGAASARQQEILTLADRGASAAKVEYALALAGELDSLEALQAAEAREAAAKQQSAAAVAGMVSSLERENQSLTMTAGELLEFQMRSSGATAAQVAFALEVQRTNAAILDEQTSLRNLGAAEAQAARYAQDLIEKLRFQNDTLGMSAEAVERLTLRKRGLSDAEIESVIALQRAATAQRDLQQTENEAAAAAERDSDAVRRLVADLREEQMALGATDEELLRRRLVTLGADQATVNLALSIKRSIAASNEEAIALRKVTDTQQDAARYAKDLTDRLSMQALQFGMTEDAAERLELRKRGLNAEEIRHIMTLRQEVTALQAAKEAQETLNQTAARAGAATGGMSSKTMMLTESMRGLEDAVAGFSTNGLKGMLMGTTNNINQLGSMLGGTAGLALSIGSVAGLIGVSLIPMLIKWGDNTEELRKKEQELADDQKRHHDDYMSQLAQRMAGAAQRQESSEERKNLLGDRDASASALATQLKRDKDELAKNQLDQRTIREQQFARGPQIADAINDTTGLNSAAWRASPTGTAPREKDLRELQTAEAEGARRLQKLKIDEANITLQIEETNAARARAIKRDQDKQALEEANREKNEWIKLKEERAKKEKDIAEKAASDREKAAKTREADEKRHKDLLGEVQKNDDSNLGVTDKRAAAEKAVRDRYAADIAAIDKARAGTDLTEGDAAALKKRAADARDKRLTEAKNDDGKRDKAPKELTATSVRSTDGMKDVFAALGIGQPARTMEDLAKKNNTIAQAQVDKTDELLKAVKELIPVTTGQAG